MQPPIPSKWLYEPHVRSRTELLEQRRAERLAIECLETPHRSFAHVNKLERDCLQTSGSYFTISNPIGSGSGPFTRSELLMRRREERVTNEEEKYVLTHTARLRQRPNAEGLAFWWMKMRGYVADTHDIEGSIRLNWNAARMKRVLPVDPMKEHCPAAIMERNKLLKQKNSFAEKVTHNIQTEDATSRGSRYRKTQLDVYSGHTSNMHTDVGRQKLAGRKLYIQSIAQRQLLNERMHDQVSRKCLQESQRIERPEIADVTTVTEVRQPIRCRGFINA